MDQLFNFLGERSVVKKVVFDQICKNLAALLCKVTKFLVKLISHLVQHHLPQHIPDKRQHLREKLLKRKKSQPVSTAGSLGGCASGDCVDEDFQLRGRRGGPRRFWTILAFDFVSSSFAISRYF